MKPNNDNDGESSEALLIKARLILKNNQEEKIQCGLLNGGYCPLLQSALVSFIKGRSNAG